jgi:pimeloyl-ACP methyl ester carboxylesterase
MQPRDSERRNVIVLLHGMGMSAAVWDATRAHLPDSLALDLPGHGARAHEAPLDNADELADHVARVVHAPTFVVVGHSMGGAIAQALMRRHRERVERAVLVASALRFPAAAMMLEAARADMHAFRAMFNDGLGAVDVVPRSRALVDACSDEALVADINVCASFDARPFADASGARRVTVVGGDLDDITPPKAWRRLAELWSARLVEVGAHGHMLPEVCPMEIARVALEQS